MNGFRGWLMVASGVSAAWVLIGVVLGSQTALGMTMQGEPATLSGAIRTAWVNNLPWIPASLISIWLSLRFPLSGGAWRRSLGVHVIALPAVSWIANVGVVLGFWMMAGTFGGMTTLARQAAFWGTIRIHVAALVYGTGVALTHTWVWYRDGREREVRVATLESELNRARYQALSAQMRPHFLFNTLHTIGQLWRSQRSDDAEQMLDHLGSLFQRVHASTERPVITLREETSMVEEYLAIEEARFPDRLRTSVRIEEAARRCTVPPLLLQPIVENAIRHGVSASPSGGTVTVMGSVEGGRLVIEVCDDGPGLDVQSAAPGTGTGLSNTRERLQHMYGDDASMTIANLDSGGTCVRMVLPATPDLDFDEWSSA